MASAGGSGGEHRGQAGPRRRRHGRLVDSHTTKTDAVAPPLTVCGTLLTRMGRLSSSAPRDRRPGVVKTLTRWRPDSLALSTGQGGDRIRTTASRNMRPTPLAVDHGGGVGAG